MNVASPCIATRRQPARLEARSFRQHHGWLRSCRAKHVAGSLSAPSVTQAQRTTGPVHLCYASAAQPQKQHGTHFKANLPDISELSPHMQQQWHPDNNALLGNIKVKPHSPRKVLWSCPDCPACCPHIWLASVTSRTSGCGCPYCQGRKLCKHNSLATKAPTVARYWDHNKNAKTPEQTLAGSHIRVEWKCPDCKYEWQASIRNKVFDGSGCPRCSSGKYSKQPTFQAAEHTLLLEWDHERNARDGIYPLNTTLQSHKLVHWVCHKCPKGRLHRYRMRAYVRTGKHAQGCPLCAAKQACDCNSLAACAPVIAAEWDFAKNDSSPADVTGVQPSGLVEERQARQLEATRL